MPTPAVPARVADRYAAMRASHVDAVRGAYRRHTGQLAVSHESAAIVRGAATYDIPSRPHLTRTGGARRNGRFAKVAVAELLDSDVQFVDGMWVTTLARTVIDVARTRPFIEALVVADSALRAGVTRAELEQLLVRMERWPGIRSAKKVVHWADPGAETALESVIRGRCILLDLPIPELQVLVNCLSGREAWVDFYWRRWGLVGEADGRTKYDGPDGPHVLWREKQRRDDIEEVRLVTRWTWAQAHAPDDVFRSRLLNALTRAERYMQALGLTTGASPDVPRPRGDTVRREG